MAFDTTVSYRSPKRWMVPKGAGVCHQLMSVRHDRSRPLIVLIASLFSTQVSSQDIADHPSGSSDPLHEHEEQGDDTTQEVVVTARRDVVVTAKTKCFSRPADPDVPPPKLIGTYPKDGGIVRPGIVVIRFTFDEEMRCAWGYHWNASGKYNPCHRTIILYPGRRVFKAVCQAFPGDNITLDLNGDGRGRFRNSHGTPLAPVEVKFRVDTNTSIRTVHEALSADPDYSRELDSLAR